MIQISAILHTASPDNFLITQGIPSYFAALIENLTHQTTKNNFELIYVDTYYDENWKHFKTINDTVSFQIKHVPVHQEHRYWYDQNYCFIAAAKNTGILYADGELLISFDDAEFFPESLLEAYWSHYRAGRYMHALHKRFKRLELVTETQVALPLTGDVYINDHRWKRVESGKHYQHRYGTWLFAGTSFSLGDALVLNGYNERLDGCKSLDDCDFGNRLHWLGRSFALDPTGWVALLDHPHYSDIVETGSDGQQTTMPLIQRKKINNLIAIENYGMVCCAFEIPEPRANCQPLSEKHWEIIRRETLKYRHFDPLALENQDKLNIWKQTPTFDLRKQREALRTSTDWIW